MPPTFKQLVAPTALWVAGVGLTVMGEGPRACGQQVSQDAHILQLEEAGVTLDVASLAGYLESLHPDEQRRRRVEALIARLGHDDYSVRESATQELMRLPPVYARLLEQAIAARDPEVRWRARHVYSVSRERGDRVLFALFSVISKERIKGLAEPILRALPQCGTSQLRSAARRALLATVDAVDAEVVRDFLTAADPFTRSLAVDGLEVLLGPEAAAEDLRPLLKDPDDEVRLSAANVLARLPDRETLAVLGELLEAENVIVRSRAANLLRALTGQNLRYVPYEPAQKRAADVARWQAWIATEGRTAVLKSPADQPRRLLGRTLISDGARSRLYELDAQGREVWGVVVKQAYGCHALPDGRRLAASYIAGTVTEFDADGNESWTVEGLNRPYSVERLENGNTLVACYGDRQVLEIAPDKRVVWSVTMPGSPRDARRLSNGNTLVCLYSGGKVVEVDPDGNTVWELEGLAGPYSAQRLDNGNTLVSLYRTSRVCEFDAEGQEVWSCTGRTRVQDAQRLPNGNTLVVDFQGVREVDVAGNVVWEHAQTGLRRAFRY